MLPTGTQTDAISDAYDVIAKIWLKQDGIVSFDLCYGDGTRFPMMTKRGVKHVWDAMQDILQRDAIKQE